MLQESRLKLRLEFLWWVFTILVAAAILIPIYQYIPTYPFFQLNFIFILIFITFTRYIFLLKHTWLARREWPKLIILGSSTILIFVLITSLGDFNSYVREIGLQELVTDLPVHRQQKFIRFIHNEMIFFGVGSVLSAIALPLRMLISIWRGRNTGGV